MPLLVLRDIKIDGIALRIMNKWKLLNGSTTQFSDHLLDAGRYIMYDRPHEVSKCEADCNTIKQTDIKTSIQQNISYLERSIRMDQERLRVEKEKLRLINKNKDLEAYINLDRMR